MCYGCVWYIWMSMLFWILVIDDDGVICVSVVCCL